MEWIEIRENRWRLSLEHKTYLIISDGNIFHAYDSDIMYKLGETNDINSAKELCSIHYVDFVARLNH